MPTLTVYGDTSDGHIDSSSSSSYAAARDGTGGHTLYAGLSTLVVGQNWDGTWWDCYEGFIALDTSALGAEATIDSATLYLYESADNSTTDFTFSVRTFDWGTALEWPTDWRTPTQLSALSAQWQEATSTMGVGWQSSTVGTNSVNKTGVTRYVLSSSRHENGTEPTGAESITFRSADYTGTTYDPRFVIIYTGTITVTPTTASLTLTGFAPTVSINPSGVVSKSGYTLANTVNNVTSITGLGFQPKFVILTGQLTDGNGVTNGQSRGFSDGTNHRSVAWAGDTGAGTSNVGKRHDDTKCLTILSNGTPTVLNAAVLAIDSDGFTLTFDSQPGAQYGIGWEAFGGTDITNVAIGTLTAPTSPGNVDTNVGFVADMAQFLTSQNATAGPASAVHAQYAWGVAAQRSNSASMAIAIQDGQTNSNNVNACSVVRANALCGLGLTSALDFTMDVSSFDQGGAGNTFRVNFADAPSVAAKIFYLAVKGGAWAAGTQAKPTGATTQTVTGNYFKPESVGLVLTSATVVGTIAGEAVSSFGSATATSGQEYAQRIRFPDAVSGSVNGFRASNRCAVSTDTGGEAYANLTSFNNDGFTLTWGATGAASQVIWYAAGDTTVVTPTTATLTLTGQAPNSLYAQTVTPSTASLAITQQTPKTGLGVNPANASLTLTGFAPTLKTTLALPTPPVLSLTGYAPTTFFSTAILIPLASLTLTTFVPLVRVIGPPSPQAAGAVVQYYRFEQRNNQYAYLQDLTPAIVKADITMDNDRAVVRTAKFTIDSMKLPASFDPATSNISVTGWQLVDGEMVSYPLGTFRLDVTKEEFQPTDIALWEADGADLTSLLGAVTMDAPFTLTAGTDITSTLRQMCLDEGLSQSFPYDTLTLPVAHTWEVGTTKLEVMNDLLESMNWFPVFDETGQGVLTSRKREMPHLQNPAVTYSTTEEPRMIIPPFVRKAVKGKIPNRVTVKIEEPSRPLAFASREDDRKDSPTSTANVPLKEEEASGSLYQDAATIAEVSEYYLRDAAADATQGALKTTADFRRKPHESYTLHIEGIEEGTLWRVRNWRLSMETGAVMTHTLGRVRPFDVTVVS